MSLPDVAATDWPEILWTDYPFAAVRLTTVVHGGAAYLLFGYVELIPEEIPHPCDYHIKAPNFLRKSRIEVSLSVLPSREALQWYESALSGQLVVPKISSTVPIQTIKLAPEPRIGCFIAAATPPIVAQWHAHPRMHRLVPMQEIPAPVSALLNQPESSERRNKISKWLERHTFLDLAARLDCAGAMVLLAPNPVLRSCNEYPLRFLVDGREVIGIKAISRQSRSLTSLSIRLHELRPDGCRSIENVLLDFNGKAEIVLPQRANETALEINCAERGLLSMATPHGFIRSIRFNTRLIHARLNVEVPARRKGAPTTSHSLYTSEAGPEASIGEDYQGEAASRLAALLDARAAHPTDVGSEVIIYDNRWKAAFLSEALFREP